MQRRISPKIVIRCFDVFDISSINITELRKMWFSTLFYPFVLTWYWFNFIPETLWNSFSHPYWWDTEHVQARKSSLLICMVQGHDNTTEKGKKATNTSVLSSLLFQKPLQQCRDLKQAHTLSSQNFKVRKAGLIPRLFWLWMVQYLLWGSIISTLPPGLILSHPGCVYGRGNEGPLCTLNVCYSFQPRNLEEKRFLFLPALCCYSCKN